ncbi:MAG: hypothetical protein QOJ32_431 [Frankiaceae bacterium]|jgi:hypothetical protein|nr:hypothetical protein [Frankiaceae bacterium]
MKVPTETDVSQDWVITSLAPEFRLLDVWALPAEGDAADFDDLVSLMSRFDPARSESGLTRLLFQVRFRLGGLLGWDDEVSARPIPGSTQTSLRERLPSDLRGSADVGQIGDGQRKVGVGFTPVYRTDREWAAELSNATVHGVLHLGWVPRPDGRYRGQLGVWVAPRGLLGEAYLRLIEPFRRFVVYPAMMRQVERMWAARGHVG